MRVYKTTNSVIVELPNDNDLVDSSGNYEYAEDSSGNKGYFLYHT